MIKKILLGLLIILIAIQDHNFDQAIQLSNVTKSFTNGMNFQCYLHCFCDGKPLSIGYIIDKLYKTANIFKPTYVSFIKFIKLCT